MIGINNNRQEIKEWIYTILIAIVLVIIIRTFILDSRVVPSTSMVPSIVPGDRLFVEKLSHRFAGLNRGDVVVFKPPAETGLKDDLIKRLIALPGDTVEVKNGKLYLNDVAQDEPYLNGAIEYKMAKQIVPPDSIFVMGDNRNQSLDSHIWGVAQIASIKGKAWVTYWPLNRIKVW